MLNVNCSTKQKEPVWVGNKVIGYIEGNRFIKPVVGSKHKLRQPPAWAIDADVFDREVKPVCTQIVIVDKEAGTEYHATVETFDSLKGSFDRGFGRQYFLTLNAWKTHDNGNGSGNGHKQLSLFDAGGDAIGYR
ncbi:hypothetical protein ACFLWE_00410 [Chloroflexota bacterium]